METCTWTQEDFDCDWWNASCGESFTLNDGSPVDNGMKFCCYCGKTLKEEKAIEEDFEA